MPEPAATPINPPSTLSNEEYGEVEHRRGFTGGWPADHCESRRKCEAGGTYVSEIAR